MHASIKKNENKSEFKTYAWGWGWFGSSERKSLGNVPKQQTRNEGAEAQRGLGGD